MVEVIVLEPVAEFSLDGEAQVGFPGSTITSAAEAAVDAMPAAMAIASEPKILVLKRLLMVTVIWYALCWIEVSEAH